MSYNYFGKRVLACFFAMLLVFIWVGSASYTGVGRIYLFIKQGVLQGLGIADEADTEEVTITIDDLEAKYVDSFTHKQSFIDMNGAMAKKLNMQGYYSDMGMYITDNQYIISAYAQTSTDYEYEQIVSLKQYLDEKGINLVYVNEPIKYLDDNVFRDKYGIESYGNRNADLFLLRASAAGINTIDLREELVQDGLNIYDMFYRTDHHWTTRSGLWASEKIAKGLNKYCGYAIDTSIYDESNYVFTEWKKCWLGEQGRKVAASYVGLDDYVEIKPNFVTSYAFKTNQGLVQGTFDDFVDETVFNTSIDVYRSKSWHYAYVRKNVINNNAEYGKVLVLGDSYEQVVIPFLSLGISQVDSLILREFDGDLRKYIDAGNYDTILICYAQFMIGAHDNPNSANYSMFSFE